MDNNKIGRLLMAVAISLGMASCSIALVISENKKYTLGFVEAHRQGFISLKNIPPNKVYTLQWWDIDKGGWQGNISLATGASGTVQPPGTPDENRSWAFRLLQVS